MDLKLLGLSIKNCRKSAELTQAKLAEKTELSTVHISHIESGSVKMSVDTLIKICNVLKTTPNDILWGQFDMPDKGEGYKSVLMENKEYGINAQLSEKTKNMSQEDKRLMLEIAELLSRRN